jgi:quercetin dioxygenase-like cupin family protein
VLGGGWATDIGTELLLSNPDVRVWSFVIRPGAQCPIHAHHHSYFFVNFGKANAVWRHVIWSSVRYNDG